MTDAKTISLHPGQSAAWETDSRFVSLIAGTGGGKTFFGPLWLYREIMQHPSDTWIVVAPTYKILKRATVPELIKAFRGTDAEGTYKRSTNEYHLPNGGIIYCCSADKPEYLEGGQHRGAWLDEAGQMKRWAWVVIQARLGVKQGRCLITTTPYGRNWLYQEVLKRWQEEDEDYFCIQFPSTMNPAYPLKEYERMKGALTKAEFGMRYDGLFTILAGLILPNFEDSICDQLRIPTPGARRVGAIDFGWSKPSCVLTAFLSNNDVHLYRELYEVRKLTRDIADSLDPSASYWADPSAAKEIEELVGLGYDVSPANNTYRAGIIKTNEYILDKRLHVPRTACPALISEAATYVIKEGDEKPAPGLDDHAVDALRYLIMGVDSDMGTAIYFV